VFAEQRDNGSTDQRPINAEQFLIEQVRAGDEEAWRQLIARYEGRLRAFARMRLPGSADAEDAVQEVFLGFLQSLPHFDASRSLETYLFAILRYKIGDACRRKRMPTPADFAPSGDEFDDLRERPGPTETPSSILRQKESLERQRALLAEALKRLIRDYGENEKFRDLQVVELSFYAGRRNKEIAEQLGMDEKHVAGVKFRAIGRLRELITAPENGAEASVIEELTDEASVASVWRDRRCSCLERSTLGAYLDGALEEPWRGYVRFHLEVIGCPICQANVADLEAESQADEERGARREQLFMSSVGFLKTTRG
jgi:RNA polymerase sigma-70 factor (ECF subfamily)